MYPTLDSVRRFCSAEFDYILRLHFREPYWWMCFARTPREMCKRRSRHDFSIWQAYFLARGYQVRGSEAARRGVCRRAGGARLSTESPPNQASFRARVAQYARAAPRLRHSLNSPLQSLHHADRARSGLGDAVLLPLMPRPRTPRRLGTTHWPNSISSEDRQATPQPSLWRRTPPWLSGLTTFRLAILILFELHNQSFLTIYRFQHRRDEKLKVTLANSIRKSFIQYTDVSFLPVSFV